MEKFLHEINGAKNCEELTIDGQWKLNINGVC